MASQITDVSIVCSAVCSGADQINHPMTSGFPSQRASIAENVPFDDVIMTDEILSNFVMSTVPVDGLAPLGAKPSAGIAMTKFGCSL